MVELLLSGVDMTLPVWLGCAATLALGAFVQRSTGFGLAVGGAPLLLLLEPRLVPVVLVLFGFTVALTTLRHYWREVQPGEIATALVGRIPGNALGLWLLLAAPMAVLEKLIAGSVLFAVAVTLFRFRLPVNRATLFGAGVFSGIFGTIAALSGPPLVLLLHGFSPDRLRGTLSAFFVVTALMTLVTLGLGGLLRAWHFGVALTFAPGVLAGSWLAGRVAHRLDRRLLQGASLSLCTLAALGLLL
ncbi:sulfite exporter TauE/SafE family protein [Halomonas alkalicola]|uniref:Probable membrane transporter protein n=1 Tax=Halomonas alkalicola TaxID=1930622 RepID=A0ABY9H4A2_9GAMM|nr:sulfite exporter TauE/SafE family protein [Halomonas alkalicola]WLI73223.1 sulfite exporter TauE/SafE family protein [Halomonas alkalicola]